MRRYRSCKIPGLFLLTSILIVLTDIRDEDLDDISFEIFDDTLADTELNTADPWTPESDNTTGSTTDAVAAEVGLDEFEDVSADPDFLPDESNNDDAGLDAETDEIDALVELMDREIDNNDEDAAVRVQKIKKRIAMIPRKGGRLYRSAS